MFMRDPLDIFVNKYKGKLQNITLKNAFLVLLFCNKWMKLIYLEWDLFIYNIYIELNILIFRYKLNSND